MRGPPGAWRWLLPLGALAVPAGCPSETASSGASQAATSSASHAASTTGSPDASSAVSTSATSASSGAGGCDSVPQYPSPPGWVGYTDWQCNGCRLYVPESKASFPKPIGWEKCPASPGGINCQSMIIDWTMDKLPLAPGLVDASLDGPVLAIQRNAFDGTPPHLLHVVADADGPVRSAILALKPSSTASAGCFAFHYALNEGKYVFKILGDDAYGKWALSPHKGASGGAIDGAPSVLGDFGEENSWACSANRVYRLTPSFQLFAYKWDMSGETLVSSAAKDPEGLQFGQFAAHGENFFWTSDNLYVTGINSWNPVDGARPFIRYIGDATRGAGNLGTDGKDLVWTYAEGKQPGDFTIKFPVRSIMTAPFTTDPAKLLPKRLRSDPVDNMSSKQYQVRCGYAAHGGGGNGPVIVVRLVDGVSWLLPAYLPPDFGALNPIGVTCDHVYLWGQFGGRYNIARVRLDSLGPGIPPD
jgi:hypothetical protein